MAKPRTPLSVPAEVATPSTVKAAPDVGAIENAKEGIDHMIVGIGASAGGLDAFRSFFSEMPTDSGIAFVLVQHLDPDYNSALAEIIGECTAMPVVKAADGTVAAPNTVSVIPQNAILKIESGVLRVALPETPTARRSSIDAFLVSLASAVAPESCYGFDQQCRVKAIEVATDLNLAEQGAHLSINFMPNAVYEPRACTRLTLATAMRTAFLLTSHRRWAGTPLKMAWPLARGVLSGAEDLNVERPIFPREANCGFLLRIRQRKAAVAGH